MNVVETLSILLADTYALYLKTQNYHWHVKGGPEFKGLHELFESQYRELAEAIDEIAERIRILGSPAPATFQEFERLKRIKDGKVRDDSNEMVKELAADHVTLVKDLNQAMSVAQQHHDEGSANLISDRISAHEKASWMLHASVVK